jgi:hypothetical protein
MNPEKKGWGIEMFSGAVFKESCHRSVVLKYLQFADHRTIAEKSPQRSSLPFVAEKEMLCQNKSVQGC